MVTFAVRWALLCNQLEMKGLKPPVVAMARLEVESDSIYLLGGIAR